VWIFDLAGATASVLIIIIPGAFALRRYQQLKHPELTLQEEIEYYENLNTHLDQQQEVEWQRRLGQ